MHLDNQIDTTQGINITLTTPGDNPPVWAVETGDSTLRVAADGLSADFISSDFPGETTYSVKGTRGGALVNDSFTLTVVEAPAEQSFNPVVGTPFPKNAPLGTGARAKK
jgi:hypothetical protein